MSIPSVSAMEPTYSHTSMRPAGLSLSQLSHASLKQMSALSASHASIHSAYGRVYTDGTGGPSAKALFKERMELCLEWFNGWTDGQRRKFLSSLGVCFKPKELLQLASLVELKAPKEQLDFANVLTREVSLRILSLLDPRSLCRCSQVSWHWLWLSEQESLWQPKCVERGWYLHYSPLPKQHGAWKQHYVACLMAPPSGVHLPLSSQHLRTKQPYLTRSVPLIQQEDWENVDNQQLFGLSQSSADSQLRTTQLEPSLPFYLSPQREGLSLRGEHKPWLDPDPHPEDLEKGWRSLCQGSLAMHRSADTLKHGSLHPSTYSSVSRAYSKASAFLSARSPQPAPSQTTEKRTQKLTATLTEPTGSPVRPSTAPPAPTGPEERETFKPVPVSALSVPDAPWYKVAGLSNERSPLFYAPPSLYHSAPALPPATRDLHYYVYPHTDYCSLARGLPTLYHPRLLLLPSSLLSWQLLAAAAQPDALCLVFSPSDATLPSLARSIDSLLAGRIARSVAVFSPLASNLMPLHSIVSFGPRANLVDPGFYVPSWEGDTNREESADFISFIRGCILPTGLGSRIDIFSPSPPADSSHPRLHSICALSRLLQLPVSCPSSLTALYSLRNEEWTWVTPSQSPEDVSVSTAPSLTPPALYFVITGFLSWCHLAESATESLRKIETHLYRFLRGARREIVGSLAGRAVHHALGLGPSSDMVMMTDKLRPILLKYSDDVIADQLDSDAFSDDVIGLMRHGEELEEYHPIVAPEVWPAHLLGPNAGSWRWFEGTGLSQRLCYPMLWGHNLTEWGSFVPPKDRRGRVLWEWFHTELTYSHMLHLALQEYHKPLRAAAENSLSQPIGLTAPELEIVFADIQVLKQASSQQLTHLDSLLTHWESSSSPTAVPLIFSLLSSLTVYKNYVFNYPALARTLNQATHGSGRLRVFLRRVGEQPYTCHASLPTLLLAPLQRIRSLYQLLSSLVGITPDAHPDTTDAAVTLARLASLLTEADSLEQRASAERELVSLASSIRGCPLLVEVGRELQGSWRAELMVSTHQGSERNTESVDSLKIYIFSDALLLSRVKECHHGFSTEVSTEEEFLDSIGLNRVTIREFNSGAMAPVGCEIKGARKVWKVAFISEEEKVAFLECFTSLAN